MKWMMILTAILIQDDHDSSSVKALLPDAESIQKRDYVLSKDQQEKVKLAAGSELPPAKVIYHSAEAQLQYPEEGKYKTRTLVIKADGIKGPIRLAVSIIPQEHMVIAVRVLEHKEGVDLNESAFLEQFAGLVYTTDSLWRSRNDLVDRERRAAKPGNDDDKLLDLLMVNKLLMGKASELFSSAGSRIRANDADAVKDLKELQQGYEDLAEKSKAALFLDDAKRKKFANLAIETKERFKAVSELTQAAKFSEAQDKFAEIGRKGCGACHGSFQGTFRSKREELGLGNGYFAINFELKASTDLDQKLQEAVALSVRRAVMLLELAPD